MSAHISLNFLYGVEDDRANRLFPLWASNPFSIYDADWRFCFSPLYRLLPATAGIRLSGDSCRIIAARPNRVDWIASDEQMPRRRQKGIG
ncbi:MAG: hypothetical protein ACREMQ_01110, partial [Longimicrobiales bacterium]